ncbi:ABC transporter permease [Taibaiella chishuiensis]|uniref:ABC transporter permease n=1 Tax=Taibaiella chishuiensis TaxID=1434707 RepID=UPI001FE84D19|nr:ABC transporter permease [Taibaiella chishuiensis]
MNGQASIYRRFKSNKPALIALVLIVCTALVAVFAYPLSPDSTPAANTMTLELSARPMGHKQLFLLIPKQRPPDRRNAFYALWAGQPGAYQMLPVNGYTLRGDTIYARHYIDYNLEDTLRLPLAEMKMPPGTTGAAQWLAKERTLERRFLLGTDRYGRDILSRLLIGARVSIAVGIVSVVLSLSIGILLGALAGWYGGWVDGAVMWLINILWSIPTLLLVFAITLTIGKGFWEIFIAIGLTSWVSAARLIRGQVMQLKEMDYITAAKALGYRDSRIIFRHIVPNIAGPVMVIAAANFATAILIEAGLSFLGIGVQPPTPSWGLMIKEHYNFLIAGNPLPALIPGLVIMILVLAFNIVGNALRDAIDVR